VSASVNLPLHHKVQKFSSDTGSPRRSRRKGRKTVVAFYREGFFTDEGLTDVNVTDADDDEGRRSVEHAERHVAENHAVEEVRERKAQDDGDDAAEREPDGEGRENEHQDDDGDH